jgi:hypothetical protein
MDAADIGALFVDGVSSALAAVLVACATSEALGALGEVVEQR